MGKYRLRLSVKIQGQKPPLQHYSLYVSLLGSSYAYWDGVLIGENGKVGESKQSEVPGILHHSFLIPDSLMQPGNHQVELLVSNFWAGGKIRFYGVWVRDYLEPMVNSVVEAAIMHIYAGCFLIIGLFYGVRYLANRTNLTQLAFSLLCLAFFALVIFEYLRAYYPYAYSWHFTRLRIILGITILIAFCLPLFFAWRFSLSSYKIHLAGLLVIFLGLLGITGYGYDLATNLAMIAGFILASIFCLQAFYQKKSGSLLALLGVVPITLALLIWYRHYDTILYIGFAHLVLMMLISLAIKEQETTRLKEEALLLSSRLEVELLKKNIQPHFLMNSITSAMDWIERNPQEGVKLLMALSREFEILLDISSKKRIPIVKELELCHTHLQIMGFRKEQVYQLSTTGIDEYEIIPPAIFLTVIENGISHQNAEEFEITKTTSQHTTTYRILAKGKSEPAAEVFEYGTGLKYIEARLEESYPGKWELNSQPVKAGWLSTITITT